MAGLFRRTGFLTSDWMEIKPQWEPGPGIRVMEARNCQGRWIVKATASGEADAPAAVFGSTEQHSAYVRRLQDLPVQGMIVELQVSVTRWRCCNTLSRLQQTFVDLVDQAFMPHARQTRRVAEARAMRPIGSCRGRATCRTLDAAFGATAGR